MKKSTTSTLIKDVILIALLGGFAALFFSMDASTPASVDILLILAVAGLPFGWRWASKLITATSLKGIGIKLLISVLLGFIAIFVVVIKDIIVFIHERRASACVS